MSKFVLTNNLTKFKTSLDDFKVRGYKLSREITANNFYFACHHKRSLNDENILELPNGDFVCATGAFIYRGLKGIQALEKFYLEFKLIFLNLISILYFRVLLFYLRILKYRFSLISTMHTGFIMLTMKWIFLFRIHFQILSET
jgi:hypothetical protein